MTLSFNDRYVKYSPVVSTTDFIVDFPIFSTSDLRVVVDGAVTFGYAVTATFVGGRADDAVVSLNVGVVDVDVEIVGNRQPGVSTNYLPTSPDLHEVIQLDMERAIAATQELRRDVARSILLVDPLGTPPTLTETEADAVLVFSPDGTSIIPGPTTGDISSAVAAAAEAAASAATATAAAAAAVAAENSLIEWKGSWVTATAYAPSDVVKFTDGNAYICLIAHTSGTFATDLASNRWEIFLPKGAAGAGSGDVEAANAGSEYAAVLSSLRANIQVPGRFTTSLGTNDILADYVTRETGFWTVPSTPLNGPSGAASGDFVIWQRIDSNTIKAIYLRADGEIFVNIRASGSWGGWVQQATVDYVDAAISDIDAVLHVQDLKPDGTNGGTFTSGSWIKRTLPSVPLTNTISGASISSAQITLPAGTYEVWIRCPAYAVNSHQSRLYNVTDGALALLGSSAHANAANLIFSESHIRGRITIAGTKVFEVQHRCATTRATYGLGAAGSFGDGEIYTDARFKKIA